MLSARDRAILDELASRKADDGKSAIEQWCPQTPTAKQQEFLDDNSLEVLFGGSAGPGKSSGLLMAALMHANTPGYAALIVRRTHTDLALPGAIMDRSHEWLGGTRAHWNGTTKTWTFPSGATLTFGYLAADKDRYRYQGAELQFIGADEMTQFPEASIRYLMSRLRRVDGVDIPLRFRGASNPGGVGHDWVYDRYVDPKTREDRVFIPATLADNKHVDEVEYRKALAKLDETTRRQLEDGEWIKDTEGLVYKYSPKRNLVQSLPDLPRGADWWNVLALDFGASLSKPTTSFNVWQSSRKLEKAYLTYSTKHGGMDVTDIANTSKKLDKVFGLSRMVADHGALGVGYIREMRARHGLPLVNARKKNKFGYIKILNGAFEKSTAMVVDGHTGDWQDEASSLLWDDTGLKEMSGMANHCCDGALYGYREAQAYLYQETEDLPEHGTTAYYEQQEREMLERAEERAMSQSNDPMNEMFG